MILHVLSYIFRCTSKAPANACSSTRNISLLNEACSHQLLLSSTLSAYVRNLPKALAHPCAGYAPLDRALPIFTNSVWSRACWKSLLSPQHAITVCQSSSVLVYKRRVGSQKPRLHLCPPMPPAPQLCQCCAHEKKAKKRLCQALCLVFTQLSISLVTEFQMNVRKCRRLKNYKYVIKYLSKTHVQGTCHQISEGQVTWWPSGVPRYPALPQVMTMRFCLRQ